MKQIASEIQTFYALKMKREGMHFTMHHPWVVFGRLPLDKYCDDASKQNREGNLPIHVASKKGHANVVKEYISKYTYRTEYLGNKGRDILHVAAEIGNPRLVKYILANNKLQALVNTKDQDGSTPLHLASKHGRPITTYFLDNLADQKSDKNAGNQEAKGGLTYIGVMMTLSILHFFGDREKSRVEYFDIRTRPVPKEEIKSRIEIFLVLAVLVASVTFAGLLQLPKSESQLESQISDITTYNIQKQGVSEENEGDLRNLYIYFDMLALSWAVMASIILCWSHLYGAKVAELAVWVEAISTGVAVYMMWLAFVFAVAINTSKSFGFFIYTILVGGVTEF
ncbi:unnamed protein product [Dovyalis caffra]|uniref:PGG domain-containing protein n=1 Tax=Dovyalis caffra TaxID=77055 RepID=A0AAV1SHR8_9ROSI|nr:unnamed protein product [Dovyalis caffra]